MSLRVRNLVRTISFLVAALTLAPQASAFDVLVGNNAGPRAAVLEGATGALKGFLLPPCDSGLTAARGPTTLPDGRIYVGMDGSVVRFDAATGAFVDEFRSGLPGVVQFPAARAPDGSIWTSLTPGDRLIHTEADGDPIGEVVTASPVGLAIGADGNLYVGSFAASGQISRFNPATGAFIDVFATAPGPVGGIAFDPDGSGRLCAGLPTLNDIVCFDAAGVPLGSFIQPGDPRPSGVRGPVWGPDGLLYVSSNATGEVLRYEASGNFLDVFASGLESPGAPGFAPDLPASVFLLPPVDTTSGPVRGRLECGVRRYHGIPYAEAPTGDLRWRRPVRKATSPTEIIALSHGPVCMQYNGAASGSEDCLRLSIWRPDSPPTTPLPVLFYIHGGGLWTGSMAWGVTDGAAFARTQNAIVVAVQYRLGALGFLGLPQLASEDANGSTGNYGFLDQLEALRWVRDNIAAFGGDPNQVTIAGQSAGGWSTCVLLASPLSDGLFRAAVVQSGMCQNARPLTLPATSPVLNDPFFGDTIYERGDRVVASTGTCTQTDPAAQLECLRMLPASSLVQAYSMLPRGVNALEQPVNPAIDGYVLTEQPVVMLRQGAGDGRALMIGTTANESTYYSQAWDPIFTPALYDTFVRAAAGNTRADALLPLYPAASYTPVAEAFRTLIEDTILVCPTLDTADAATEGGSPSFVYHLTFPPTYLPSSTQAGLRTFHGLDLYYVFGTYARLTADYGIGVDEDDAALSASMQNAWGSFVRLGVPTTMPAWPVYAPTTPGDLASVSVLQFDVPNNTVTGTAFRSGRCAAFFPVANQLDPDRDIALPADDNCPTLANTSQADAEADLVGDLCDSCRNVANSRVAAGFLAANPWATLTGGQRDDDHDGYGNRCDAKFGAGSLVNAVDLSYFRASLGRSRTGGGCGQTGTLSCAIFDLDEIGALINATDLARFRQLNGKLVGPKCPSCPLTCEAGASGSCD